jgi:hypothetical protein
MPLNCTGGAPFSNAGVRSTSFGMMPLFNKLIIPLLMSSSEIGGGLCSSSYSSKYFLCLMSLICLAFITAPKDFFALYGPFLFELEAVGFKIPAPFALSSISG